MYELHCILKSIAFDIDRIYLVGIQLRAKSVKFTHFFYMFKSDNLQS